MLWYKSWLETRWRFLIGLALVALSACETVLIYPQIVKLLDIVPPNLSGPLGAKIRESVELARHYQSYVWSKWYRESGIQWSTLFAVLLGCAGILSPSAGRLFTLSLPVTRRRVMQIRAATGLAELFALALIPSVLIPLFSPAIGERYGIGGSLVHALCLFITASVFFFLAFLLSTMFDDVWRPLLIALIVAVVFGCFDFLLPFPYGVYRVMSAESYFRTAHVPWIGLLASAAASAALYFGAVSNLAHRDY